MSEIRIQTLAVSVHLQSSSSIGKSSMASPLDFKSMLTGELDTRKNYEVPENWADYKCGTCFGEGMTATFPPDNAPDYFKKAWYDVTSKMDDEYRWVYFNDNVETALTYGYYFFMYDRKEGADGYNSFESRVKTLGCVGCLELAIRTQEQCYNDNVRGGNEQRFTDKMRQSLNDLKEIMAKCLESGDPSIDRQIKMADLDFEKSKTQILKEADIWLQVHGGNDLRTMSDEKFQAIMDRVPNKFNKYLPDGTILTIESKDGHIVNSFRHKPYNMDFLPMI